MKTISVIIICHNNYGLSICIKSVIKQLRPDDEIIIVNDHSDPQFLSDELSAFISKDSRIYLYSVQDRVGNRSYNRNFGAQKSAKEVLLFLDGDMVLSAGSIEAFRIAHGSSQYAGFLGNSHGMRFSKNLLSAHIGRDDYMQLLQTEEGIQELIDNPLLADWRIEEFCQPELEPYYWIYYYTCLCSADSQTFLKIGGFDDALITWGSEDIDLGYRLSHYGKIGYVKDAHGVHIPHPRNLWNENLFDRDNNRYLLDKHRFWPFELFLSFDLTCSIYQLVQKIRVDISAWNLPPIIPHPAPDTIWINIPSERVRTGTVIWFDHDAAKTEENLIGLSLPCCDQRFQAAYVSSNIFCYPMVITARILQECLRISQRVLLVPVPETRRMFWEKQCLLQSQEIYRSYYLSGDTMEYQIMPLKDGTLEVISPQIIDRLNASRSHCPVFPSSHTRKVWQQKICVKNRHFILINLLCRDSEEIQDKLENALGITFTQSYNFTMDDRQIISLFEVIPITLLYAKETILFVASSHYSFDSGASSEWRRVRGCTDFVLDLEGQLYRLGETEPIS